MQRESIDQLIDCDRAEMDSMLASVDALVKDALEDALQESSKSGARRDPFPHVKDWRFGLRPHGV